MTTPSKTKQENEKKECNCHCHHTAQYIGQPDYGMQPNWAECSLDCDESCEHCKPMRKKKGER